VNDGKADRRGKPNCLGEPCVSRPELIPVGVIDAWLIRGVARVAFPR
jgi:hypothetical protein